MLADHATSVRGEQRDLAVDVAEAAGLEVLARCGTEDPRAIRHGCIGVKNAACPRQLRVVPRRMMVLEMIEPRTNPQQKRVEKSPEQAHEHSSARHSSSGAMMPNRASRVVRLFCSVTVNAKMRSRRTSTMSTCSEIVTKYRPGTSR